MTDYRADNLRRRKRAERRAFGGEVAFVFGMVVFIWLSVWLIGKITSEGFVCESRPITVQSGDTLDGIVREHCSGEVLIALDQVVEVYGTTIHANDTIYLPTSDKCTLTIDDAGEVYEACR